MSKVSVLKDVKVYRVDGVNYLGVYSDFAAKGGKIEKAMEIPKKIPTQNDITGYFKKANLGTLETVNVKGEQIYLEKDIPTTLNGHIAICEAFMEQAKSSAMPTLENEGFDSLLSQ